MTRGRIVVILLGIISVLSLFSYLLLERSKFQEEISDLKVTLSAEQSKVTIMETNEKEYDAVIRSLEDTVLTFIAEDEKSREMLKDMYDKMQVLERNDEDLRRGLRELSRKPENKEYAETVVPDDYVDVLNGVYDDSTKARDSGEGSGQVPTLPDKDLGGVHNPL